MPLKLFPDKKRYGVILTETRLHTGVGNPMIPQQYKQLHSDSPTSEKRCSYGTKIFNSFSFSPSREFLLQHILQGHYYFVSHSLLTAKY